MRKKEAANSPEGNSGERLKEREEYLLVDGYNVIYAWPELEELAASDLAFARQKLIDILINYASYSGEKVLVFFDAHNVKDNLQRREDYGGVQVIYTASGETADMAIEKKVGELAQRGSYVYVATADYSEQRIILGRGAYRLTPRELRRRFYQLCDTSRSWLNKERPADRYLENRLEEGVRSSLERWRRGK